MLQMNTIKHYPPRNRASTNDVIAKAAYPKLSGVYFGKDDADRFEHASGANFPSKLTKNDIKPFQDAIDKIPELKLYHIDLYKSYQLLQEKAQEHLLDTLNKITPSQFGTLYRSKRLGTVEGAGDILFEVYSLNALRKNIITEDLVEQWRLRLKKLKSDETPLDNKSFSHFADKLLKSIDPKKRQEFQKIVGGSKAHSDDLLALIGTKFALFSHYDPKFRLWDDTKPLLHAEANELKSYLPDFLPRVKVSFLSLLYTNIPGLPVNFLINQLTQIIHKETKAPVSLTTINRALVAKHLRRQGLDFDFHEQYSRMQRKNNYGKGYDLLTEAALLNDLYHKAKAAPCA